MLLLFIIMRKTLIIFLLFSKVILSNVDYIAGNATYKYIIGACPSSTKFEITVTLFTKNQKIPDNFLTLNGIGGFTFIDSVKIGNNIIKSNYKITNTYPSCGFFSIVCADTINAQVSNNTNTNNKAKFYFSTIIILNTFYPPNSSYVHEFSPAVKVIKNKPFYFNAITHTSNLVYDSIITSPYFFSTTGYYNYFLPSGVKINRTSGEIQWDNPDTLGYYTFLTKTEMYKNGNSIATNLNSYKFEVISQSTSYIYDSINKVPINSNGYKEISYSANNTYSFSCIYTDLNADSVKIFSYPIDFFETQPVIIITKDNLQKNSMLFSWSPIATDMRIYPYNFTLNAISYYPNDSVINSYQTVSFINSSAIGVNELTTLSSLKLFPNPALSILNIANSQHKQFQNSTIDVKNTLGQTVLSIPFKPEVDIAFLANGVYFLQIKKEGNNIMTVKFIKD